MPAGVARILPFALISAALHAAVLMSAPERLEIAVTPAGDTDSFAVRLVPSGPTTPDPAAQSGVAGSLPEPSRAQSRQSEPAPTAKSADKATVDASPRPSVQDVTKPDRVQAALADRVTTEAAPTDANQQRADTAATEKTEQPDKSRRNPDAAEESAEAATAAKTGTSDAPDTPQAPDASDNDEKSGTPEPTQAEDANATNADTGTAKATGHTPKPDDSEAVQDEKQAGEQSGAEGADDRAQLASHARQQVEIHFRDRFRYPRIARQRGWEGRVVLSFRLQPDGRITDVEVSETSGRSILDENARKTLIHIQRVPELADRLGREPLELEVPVTYRLQPA